MRKALAKNSLANLAGGLLPAIVTLLTIPFIVRMLGDTSYGVLTVVTAIVGYFAVLDLNITSGAVKFIAQYDAAGKRKELNEVISFGLFGYGLIGLVGGAAIFVFAGPLATHVFNLPPELIEIARNALRVAAIGFFLGQVQVFLQGVPQALQRYDISARFDAAFGALAPALSVVTLLLGYGLFEIVLVRVVLSAINVAILTWVVKHLLPHWAIARPSKPIVRSVTSFAGFTYLGKLSSVFYQYADTLIIGALLGMNAVTHFSIPFTLANRVFGMAYRLAAVVFPAASALHSRNDAQTLKEIYLAASRYLFFVNASLLLMMAIFSREILHYWIGAAYAEGINRILILIALSLFIDSATNIPSLVNDGLGHPKVTGYLSVLRAALRLVVTIIAARYYDIVGVAIGHVATTAVYAACLLYYVHGRTVPVTLKDMLRTAYWDIAGVFVGAYVLVSVIRPTSVLSVPDVAIYVTLIAAGLALYGYGMVLLPGHRRVVARYLVRQREGR